MARAADNTLPADSVDDSRDDVFRMLFSGNVDLVAGELRDAYQQSENPAELADRLRSVEDAVGMLADMAEAAADE